MNKLTACLFLLLTFSLNTISSHADEDAPKLVDIAKQAETSKKIIEELEESEQEGPYDEFKRLNPRSSLLGLAKALRAKDFETATHYLDLRKQTFSNDKKKIDKLKLAHDLRVVGRRIFTISLEDISDDVHGAKNDGLPSYLDLIDVVEGKSGEIPLYIQRVPRGDGVYIWQISHKTVARIPALYAEFGYGVAGDWLSEHLPGSHEFLGMESWQFLMLFLLAAASYGIGIIATYLVLKLIQNRYKGPINQKKLQQFLSGPLRLFIGIIIFRYYFEAIIPSKTGLAIFEAKTLLIFSSLWLLLAIIDFTMSRFADRMRKNGQENSASLLSPVTTTIKVMTMLLCIITWLHNIGFQVTAVITGLGVGSIALALAAQKTLENLLGSVTVYIAQPVRIGDFCKFGNTFGTVESIGLRSTQLRTVGRTLVHVPNAIFAHGEIENLTQRDKILYRCRLRLSYDVTPVQIRSVLEEVRSIIAHTDHIDSNSRIRFIEFGDSAQELELYVHMLTTEHTQFLEYIEELNLTIVDILTARNIQLARTSNTTYLEKSADMTPS